MIYASLANEVRSEMRVIDLGSPIILAFPVPCCKFQAKRLKPLKPATVRIRLAATGPRLREARSVIQVRGAIGTNIKDMIARIVLEIIMRPTTIVNRPFLGAVLERPNHGPRIQPVGAIPPARLKPREPGRCLQLRLGHDLRFELWLNFGSTNSRQGKRSKSFNRGHEDSPG